MCAIWLQAASYSLLYIIVAKLCNASKCMSATNNVPAHSNTHTHTPLAFRFGDVTQI